jgi:hypothetical protein
MGKPVRCSVCGRLCFEVDMDAPAIYKGQGFCPYHEREVNRERVIPETSIPWRQCPDRGDREVPFLTLDQLVSARNEIY